MENTAKKKTVLIVEDNPLLREMYTVALKAQQCEVLTVSNAQGALEIAQTRHPDLIILDILMPGSDGFSVLEQLGADPKTKDIIVIVATMMNNEEYKERAKKLGAAEYILKSEVKITDLAEHVAKTIYYQRAKNSPER